MPATAAGARALLSATAATRPAASLSLAQLRTRLPRRSPRAACGLQTSPSSRSRPDNDPKNAAGAAPSPSGADAESNSDPKNAAAKSDQPAEAPAPPAADAEARREMLRSAGYGSARARAARNNRVEEAPPLAVPQWFFVYMAPLHLLGKATLDQNVLIADEDRLRLLAAAERLADAEALTDDTVQELKDDLTGFLEDCTVGNDEISADIGSVVNGLDDSYRDPFMPIILSLGRLHQALFWQALLLSYNPATATAEAIEGLRQHFLETIGDRPVWRPLRLPPDGLSIEAQRWISSLLFDRKSDYGPLRLSPLAPRRDPEHAACIELVSAVQAQLGTPLPPPAQRRPPVVLCMLNDKGFHAAKKIVEDVAAHVHAGVLHLNAHILARILGRHMGQNPYSARGPLAMLGYAAAEMNGRLAARQDANADPEQPALGVVSVELTSRLRSILPSARDALGSVSPEGRWDDLKLSAALETLVTSMDRMNDRLAESIAERSGIADPAAVRALQEYLGLNRPFLIHVHDYVELSALYPSIPSKLHTIANRLSTRARPVMVVGTSGSDGKAPQWRERVLDLSRDGAHVIPFQSAQAKEADVAASRLLEETSNLTENLGNIEEMLRGMAGDVPIDFDEFEAQLDDKDPEDQKMSKFLRAHVYDAPWVTRVASAMVGHSNGSRAAGYGLPDLTHALKFVLDLDDRWQQAVPRVAPPYFSPLHVPRGSSSGSDSIDRLPGAAAKQEYTSEEKKLLSGLIDAKDIHATFDDIVVPQDTKESLIGLTTLSLVRPDAFSYGVLKTEHITGCLLYGPPGTGKTLLGKAVAKQSGANMLSVSAADIHDKYLGQSERNVKALFSLARKLAPCVIFLDEADALLSARKSSGSRVAHRETITQFLREWDGLVQTRAFIMVATNRPFDLDEAVLRRLPRKILVDLPLPPEREAILRVMLKDERLAEDVDLARLAGAPTDLYSGSDLKNLCVSAAMAAVRDEMRARDAWLAERRREKKEKSGESPGPEEDGVNKDEEEEYKYPERRTLTREHFDKALRDISASISNDMESLKALRKFDEQYGDAGRKKRSHRGLGFLQHHDGQPGGATGEARIRPANSSSSSG
ncbi:hypothetical protein VTJ83DRAFT_6683 [Remersonia thermophila]|uniref:AAA+ ATPase domain-containing protein n=1 Tax=Remersonia thermophila TaxID=72144 RepID=A0ABR4D5F3_9PEZI